MPWVRIDDQYPEHPKIVAAGHLAAWLDVCAMAYCNRLLTDGFVAAAMVPRLSSVPHPMKRAAELVAAGRWDAVDGGFQVRDYLKYQKDREQILKERDLAARRQAKFRAGKRDRFAPNDAPSHDGGNAVTNGAVTHSPHPHPNNPVVDNSNRGTEAERDADAPPADPAAVAAALAASRGRLHSVAEPRYGETVA